MNRDIRLTRELADQIVFGMENQDHVFYLDLDTQTIVPEPSALSESGADWSADGRQDGRYIRLPEWRSVDGYNLMAQFVASLRNPIYRERLRDILASGRGVFRQFKDVVGERDDIERLWLSFKQRSMRGVVGEWVNDLRELWGLERLELPEDETTEELVATEFVFAYDDRKGPELVRQLDRIAFEENHDGQSQAAIELLYEYHREGSPDPGSTDSRVLVAETPAGEPAGFLWGVTLRQDSLSMSVVTQLYVSPEYRGIGIARALLQRHLARCHEDGYSDVIVELVGSGCDLEDDLSELGMIRESSTMSARLDRWFRDHGTA